MFNEEVCIAIGNYVYRLIDPRNGETFYVGKGVNNRIFHHAMAESSLVTEDEDEVSLKLGRIRKIQGVGLEVIHVIHRHGIPKEAVFEVEAALIDVYPGLENIQGGHGSAVRGPMHAQELILKYGMPTTRRDPNHKLVLININRSIEGPEAPSVYECVRYAWPLDVIRASEMDFVVAVRRGVVLDVFFADEWMPALVKNFPSLGVDQPRRSGFVGRPAPEQVRDLYRNTRLPADRTHKRYPIRYWDSEVSAAETE